MRLGGVNPHGSGKYWIGYSEWRMHPYAAGTPFRI
jgi:hypothetical protein